MEEEPDVYRVAMRSHFIFGLADWSVLHSCVPLGYGLKSLQPTCVKSSVSLNLPVYQHRLSFIYSFPLPTVIVSGDNY